MTPLGIAMLVALGMLVGGAVGTMLMAFIAVYQHPHRDCPMRSARRYVWPARAFFYIAVLGLLALIVLAVVALIQFVT